ncbi:integration host factor subunit beta [soil metagenome]
MIKSEIIATIARKFTQISEEDVTLGVNLIIEQLSDTLSQGDRIEIRGFGSVAIHYRPPRNAHNPKSGERLVTPGKSSPHFKPGKELRERVNKSTQ